MRVQIASVIAIAVLGLLLSGCDKLEELREAWEKTIAVNSATGKQAADSETGSENIAFSEDVSTIFAVNTTKAIRGQLLDYIELNGDVVTKPAWLYLPTHRAS